MEQDDPSTSAMAALTRSEEFQQLWKELILALITEIWQQAGLWEIIDTQMQLAESFNELVFKLLQQSHEHIKLRFATTPWCLWNRRNEKLWDHSEKPPLI
ncbi:hypothetical protein JHK84_045425 [Glycine max]|nr:hypothetical protein JHK85_045957 [Glycine max]KAG5108518.1 hypothetical protein JHK84_045425 [Glycine max]